MGRLSSVCIALALLLRATPATAADGSGSGSGTGSGAAAPAEVVAGPPASWAEPPPAKSELGMPFKVRVKAAADADWVLTRVEAVGFRYLESTAKPPVRLPDGSWEAEFVVFRTGRFEIPAASALFTQRSGLQARSDLPGFVVEIPAALANEASPEPAPQPPAMEVPTLNYWLAGGLAALIAAGLGALITVLVRRYRRLREEAMRPIPKRPPEEIAREALAQLAAENLLDAEQLVDFHLRLSEILRGFVGAELEVNATEMTTTEIREMLERDGAELGIMRIDLLRILEESDMVKFARFSLPRSASEALFADVERWIGDVCERRQARVEAPPELAGGLPPVPPSAGERT